MTRFSILNNLETCYFCGRPREAIHEVYFGRNRQTSIKYGFCVGLCSEHHNMSNRSVHHDRKMDMILKKRYQREYEKTHTREEFIKLIGRNYLNENRDTDKNAIIE